MAACALHLGFQLTVSVLVYPALREVPAAGWSAAHDLHTRRITPVVAVVYGSLVLACGLALAVGPRPLLLWLTVACVAGTFAATALAAAPTHGALGRGRDPALLRRLTRVDLVRLAFGLVALVPALLLALLG